MCNFVRLSFVLLGFLAATVVSEEELNVEIVFKPDDCEETSQDGQRLSMHYTGTLASDGSKFDSR